MLVYSYLQIAAKINPQGTQNNSEPKKRSLEDCIGKHYYHNEFTLSTIIWTYFLNFFYIYHYTICDLLQYVFLILFNISCNMFIGFKCCDHWSSWNSFWRVYFNIIWKQLYFSTWIYAMVGIPLFYWILEPEAKKHIPDPLANLRGPIGLNLGLENPSRPNSTVSNSSSVGGICNEDIRVPDKMVGLSKYILLLVIDNSKCFGASEF